MNKQIKLCECTSLSDLDKIYDLMEKSFPPEERRTREEQVLHCSDSLIKVYGLKNGADIAAFMTVWTFGEWLYIEHFAVSPMLRNLGLGGKFLDKIISEHRGRIFLEAEPPYLNKFAERRADFYGRHGFSANPYRYIQPPISKDQPPVELVLMTTKGTISESEYSLLRDMLYKYVYKRI